MELKGERTKEKQHSTEGEDEWHIGFALREKARKKLNVTHNGISDKHRLHK